MTIPLMIFFLNYEGFFSKYLIDKFKEQEQEKLILKLVWMSAMPKHHSFSNSLFQKIACFDLVQLHEKS